MSLINRMLRDLSSRQPESGDVMSGIQLPGAAPVPRANPLGKIGALLVLVAAFTAGVWFVFGPKPVKIPQPRQPPPDAAVVAEPPVAPAEPAPVQASAPAAEPTQLQIDPQLSSKAPAPEPAAEPTQPANPVAKPKSRPRPAATDAPTKVVSARKAAEVYEQARRALQRGDDRSAEGGLREALELDPKLHGAREDLGSLHVRQGRLDEAEAEARAGLALDPARPGYRRLMARIELTRGQPAAAVELLERDPPPVDRDPEYHALLASAYQRVNRHEDAARSYQALARQEPYQAAWWAGYGLSRDALGDGPGALAAYARARQLGNLDPRVLEHIDRRTLALQPPA